MKRRMNSTLLSNVGSTSGPHDRPGMLMPFSSTPRATVTMFGSATVMRRNARDFSRCGTQGWAQRGCVSVNACLHDCSRQRA